MQLILTNPVPSQIITTVLAQQPCRINLYQKTIGLFLDLYVSDVLIIGGVICEDRNLIVRDAYLGFIGDLEFQDSQGVTDPTSDGLGSRYQLIYLETTDLA